MLLKLPLPLTSLHRNTTLQLQRLKIQKKRQKKSKNHKDLKLDMSALSPIVSGAPDNRGDATAIPDREVRPWESTLSSNASSNTTEVVKESPDSPDETMINPAEIDPPMPKSPFFPPTEVKKPPVKKRYAKRTKKSSRRKLFDVTTSLDDDSKLSSKNFVPFSPSQKSSKESTQQSEDLLTEIFGPGENEKRPTLIFKSWAEATVPLEEMLEIKDFIARRPFDHKQVARETYDVMVSGNQQVCTALERKTGIMAWNMLKIANRQFTELVFNGQGDNTVDAIIIEDSQSQN